MSSKKLGCIVCGGPKREGTLFCGSSCKELAENGTPPPVLRSIAGGKKRTKKGAEEPPDPMTAMFSHVVALMTPMLEKIDAAAYERQNRDAIRQYICACIRAGMSVDQAYETAEAMFRAELEGVEQARADRAAGLVGKLPHEAKP